MEIRLDAKDAVQRHGSPAGDPQGETMKTTTKAKRGSPVRVNPIVRPLPAGSLLRHMRPPTKEFPFWYYTGPWPNSPICVNTGNECSARAAGKGEG
jgi:hypothetical protein